jgi:hypothetical protein
VSDFLEHPPVSTFYSRAKIGKPTCKRIIFIWAIRHACECYSHTFNPFFILIISHHLLAHAELISDMLMNAMSELPEGLEIVLQIYLTAKDRNSRTKNPDSGSITIDVNLDTSSSSASAVVDKEAIAESLSTGPEPKIITSPYAFVARGRPHLKNIVSSAINASEGPVSVNGG